MTLSQYPATSGLHSKSKIPLACAMQPFAEPGPGEDPVPVVDCGEDGPTRCGRCRGYVNVFCQFNHSGGHWACNLCNFQNPLPPNYQGDYNSVYGSTAQPELAKGSVDFVVGGPYISRPLQEPITLFAVDVSTVAVQTGTCGTVLRAILKIVREHLAGSKLITGGKRARVGLLTFAEAVRFYDLHSPSDSGHKTLIVSDFEEGFSPLPDSRLCVNVSEYGQQLVGLLESLLEEYGHPSAHAAAKEKQAHLHGGHAANASIAGTALQAAVSGLEACGGKVAIFFAQAPTFGQGILLKQRAETPTLYSTNKEPTMYTDPTLQDSNSFFAQVMRKCCEKQISVDVYSFGDQHKDLTSWSVIPSNTGGTIHVVPFLPETDPGACAEFQQMLEHQTRRSAALEAVLKVRASAGVRVEEYYGNGLKRVRGGELDMAFIDEDNCSVVVLAHDGTNLESTKEVYIQCAILYTSVEGQRRVRVHNLACTVTPHITDVFRNADIDAVTTVLARKYANDLWQNTAMDKVHSNFNSEVVAMLTAYRQFCAKNPTSQQLILPEALKLLPLYALAILKSPALRKNADSLKSQRSPAQSVLVRADKRCEAFNWTVRASPAQLIKSVYPMFFALKTNDNPAESAIKPNLAPSTVSFKDGDPAAFLLCAGTETYLFLTKYTDPAIYQACGFANHAEAVERLAQVANGAGRITAAPGSSPLVATLESHLAEETSFPRASRDTLLASVFVVVAGTGREPDVIHRLTEDQHFGLKNMQPYDDYLCQCHSSIQNSIRHP